MRQSQIIGLCFAWSFVQSFLPAHAQDLTPEDLKAIYTWTAEENYVEFLKSRYGEFQERGSLNFVRATSVVAISTEKPFARNVKELSQGQMIGALYLSSGSTRLKLPPGAYTVHLELDEDSFTWGVIFRDKNKNAVGGGPAQVKRVQRPEFPISYVDRSVCYRAGIWDICF